MRRLLPGILTAIALGVGACGGRLFSYHFGDDPSNQTVGEALPADDADAGADADPVPSTDPVQREEDQLEDPDALSALISDLLASDTSPNKPAMTEASAVDTAVLFAGVPKAPKNSALDHAACRAALDGLGVRYQEPTLETPLVDHPLLLDGPIDGVTIGPRFAKQDASNAVVDCHLALALVAVAREAKALGVKEVRYYSTYRLLRAPSQSCKKGRVGAACRKAKRDYNKTRATPSQHRLALGIDIGWLVTESGEVLDVQGTFERHDGTPPCETAAKTDKGRLLQRFVCDLHAAQVFSVVLTPNANAAHHNHFHLDITKGARWFILR